MEAGSGPSCLGQLRAFLSSRKGIVLATEIVSDGGGCSITSPSASPQTWMKLEGNPGVRAPSPPPSPREPRGPGS